MSEMEDLHEMDRAAWKGDFQEVRRLMRSNDRQYYFRQAAAEGRVELVRFLLDGMNLDTLQRAYRLAKYYHHNKVCDIIARAMEQ